MTGRRRVLVVGAGFAGASVARVLAEAGLSVDVIDARSHVGGNAYDEQVGGLRVHRYGPHLFHTNNDAVVGWLSRFTEWLPYEHRVLARLPSTQLVPLPINATTIEMVHGVSLPTPDDVAAFLDRVRLPIVTPRNAAEHLYGTIGIELTDLFFRPYTEKMWGMPLEEVDASVVGRLPLRLDRDDRYFIADRFQALPKNGYESVFRRILDHPGIEVVLGQKYRRGDERGYFHCFTSSPIDEWFEYAFGDLPYRSIRFAHAVVERPQGLATPVVNHTDAGPVTRETWWHLFPGSMSGELSRVVMTHEVPCDYRENEMERYYPVKDAGGVYRATYEKYREAAAQMRSTTFIGRCGTYQYLDMHQVINQSLLVAERWLSSELGIESVTFSRLGR